MKKLCFVLVMLIFVSGAGATMLVNSEFTEPDPLPGNGKTDVPGWNFYNVNKANYWPDSNDPGYENAGVLQTGWKHWDSLYQQTTHQLEADTVYTLSASVKLDRTGNHGVYLQISSVDANDVRTGLGLGGPYIAPDATDYHEYSLSIDTSDPTIAAHVGEDIRVDVRRYGTNWTDFDYVRLVPEPATMALLGLGGLVVSLKRRRKS